MSTERFKAFVALAIEQQTFWQVLERAKAANKCCSNLQACYDDMGARAQKMLAECFATSSDLAAVYAEMDADYEYEHCRNNATEEERLLAMCRHDVAVICRDLAGLSNGESNDISEDRSERLREENYAVFCKIGEYIREEYHYYR